MADACRALSCWMTLFAAIKATKQGESVSATSPFAAALCLAFSQLAFSPIESLCAADTTSTFNCRCLIDAHALSNSLRWDGTTEDLKSWKQQADNGAWRTNDNKKNIILYSARTQGQRKTLWFLSTVQTKCTSQQDYKHKKCRDLQ